MSKKFKVLIRLGANRELYRGVLAGIARFVREVDACMIVDRPWIRGTPPTRSDLEGVDGLICMSRARKASANLGFPGELVSLAPCTNDKIPQVLTDEQHAAEVAINHLEQVGAKNFLISSWSDTPRSREFSSFAAKAATALGKPSETILHNPTESGESWDDFRVRIGTWLRESRKPAGILALSDGWAYEVLQICEREKIAVPRDIMVIGCGNDTEICDFSPIPITSIDRNFEDVGYRAISLLLALMNGAHQPETSPIKIRSNGVVSRLSTATLLDQDDLVVRAVEFINEHAVTGITVSDVVNQLPVSRRPLENRFRKVTGGTILEFIQQTKVSRARERIITTTLSMSEIAADCGFSDASHINRVFRKVEGTTPGMLRKK